MNANCAIDYRYAAEQGGAALFAPGAEQKWLLQYLPLVKRIVSQLALQANQVLDREDMEQIGLMGLLECLRRYGTPDEQFGRFAALRIRGAILDELRRQDWRPRSVRQEGHRLRDGIRELRRRLGHEPSEAEVMQHLGVSAEDYLAYEQHTNAETLASFDEVIEELMLTPSAARTPEAELILKAAEGAHLIACDERGKTFSSRAFADHIALLRDRGERRLVFAIGTAAMDLPRERDAELVEQLTQMVRMILRGSQAMARPRR